MIEGLISAASKENVGTFTQQTTNENDERPKSQQEVHKSLLSSDALHQYLLTTSVYPREHPMLKKLREVTLSHPRNIAATGPDEGQFLQFLLKTIKAKNTLELGVYTGYSLLTTALSLPDDGKIIAVDRSRDYYEIGRPIIEEAGVAHKIEFRESNCMDAIQELVAQDTYHGFFDFIFVDADKNNYLNYHPILLKLVKVQGIIGYDNTLLQGAVIAKQDDQITDFARFFVDFVKEFNIYLAEDSRVEICHLPVCDGITLCRRIV